VIFFFHLYAGRKESVESLAGKAKKRRAVTAL
jgi:hypothetical protein